MTFKSSPENESTGQAFPRLYTGVLEVLELGDDRGIVCLSSPCAREAASVTGGSVSSGSGSGPDA